MKKIIEVKNLVKEYNGGVVAVNDLSFSVNEGSLFAFLGENGAGKSTTINILCNVLTKTSGQIIIDGLDANKKDITHLIGIVFQNSVLDNLLTVKDNLLTRAYYYGLNKKEALNRVKDLEKLLDLNEIMNRRFETLSGGQKRRVDIARALIHQPKILFLDEPTTGLDPKTRKLVWQIIDDLRLKNKLTVFLTTHYMEETKSADEVVILDHGVIKAKGSPVELKKQYATNKLIWYSDKKAAYNQLLKKENINYTYQNNAYHIDFNDYSFLTSFLYRYQKEINNYEVVKGDMDEVFLKVTGKELSD
ncbi:MAG: ABC transporter ATP-binding protein [Bacilli bacterium]|nr:ABC transporter ATP-binding protein [Bacilli bacterium]